MRFIFENSIMLWFPAFYLVGTCLKKSLSPNDYEKWEDNDLNWTNTKNERINIMNVEFKESQFEVSNIKLSHLSEELLLKGKFNKNKIEINIKKV
jgi:hypothetical protein